MKAIAPISHTSVLVAFLAVVVGLLAIGVCVIALIRLKNAESARPMPPVPAESRSTPLYSDLFPVIIVQWLPQIPTPRTFPPPNMMKRWPSEANQAL